MRQNLTILRRKKMTYLSSWFLLLLASLLGSMVPGISFALICRNTLRSSRSTGVWTACGLAMGMSVYIFVVLLGLAYLILHNVFLSSLLRWGGAFYLAYVGIICLLAKKRQIKNEGITPIQKKLSITTALRMGFLTNLFNPKVMLFFIALFTQFIHPGMPSSISWIFGFTIALVEFFWFSFVAILLTHPLLQQHFQSMAHWIERASGVVLLIISGHLMMSQL